MGVENTSGGAGSGGGDLPQTPEDYVRMVVNNPNATPDEIKAAQLIVGAHVDGKFGPETASKVAAYQALKGQSNKLVPEGTGDHAFAKSVAGSASKNLGRLSERYESGGRGVGTISSGKDDPGKQSYGKYQLSSATGTMEDFLKNEGSQFAEPFKGLKPGTDAFNEVYRRVASSGNADAFDKAQFEYLKRKNYDPVLAKAAEMGFKVTDRGVQEALFSQSVQHGVRGNRIILRNASSMNESFSKLSGGQQIDYLYRARDAYATQYVSREASTLRYADERTNAILISNYQLK